MLGTFLQTEQNGAGTKLVPDKVAAPLIGSTAASLRRWRFEGRGPRYRKIGAKCLYAVNDLEAYVAGRVIETRDTQKGNAAA
jgi:hypothetical protein